MDTLVLDAAYRPHKIVDWKRAVTLLFMGRCEVVESYDDREIRSVSFVMKMPAVVRLLTALRGTKKAVKFSRINILTRDRFACQFCGAKLPMRKLNYDHVLPRSMGGKTEWTNIVTSCYPCNARKDGRTPEQAGMALLRAPERPASLPLTMLRLPDGVTPPDQWATYLYWTSELEA